MAGFSGIEKMEESWQDLVPESSLIPVDDVLDTGREAYLRTKHLLDEAATVRDLLFEEDMSRRYRRAYERLDAEDEAIAPRCGLVPDAPHKASTTFGSSGHFPRAGDSGGGGNVGEFSEGSRGGVLAPAVGKAASLRAIQRRPEEQRFYEIFLGLRMKVKSLWPGHRVQPSDIAPMVHDMYDCAWEAENAARDSVERLRELRGDGSAAVAEAAVTARELSLEKDTWGLLLMMNGADHQERVIKERMRRGDSSLNHAPPGPNSSDEEVVCAMRTRDAEFRRAEHVVEWLQDVVKSRLDDLAPAARVRRGGALGWSATLEYLALGGTAQSSEISQMHPDASLRKVGICGDVAGGVVNALKVMPLVGKDDMDEEELVRTVWVLVRAGLLGDAKRLCEDRGQPWRAAAMAGGALVGCRGISYVEEYVHEGAKRRNEADGALYNPGQGLWQDMCWKLSVSLQRGADSSQGLARSVAQHEAAVFAHLAGNAKLLLDSELTRSWEDQAWVHFCALLQRKVLEERIRHRKVQAPLSSLYPGVSFIGTDERLRERMQEHNPPQTPASVFGMLGDASRGRQRAEGKGWYRQAQRALIMGGDAVTNFLERGLQTMGGEGAGFGQEQGGGWGGEEKADTLPKALRSPQQLRFAAHLALVLEAQCPHITMVDETMEAIHDAVRAYTEHLARTKQVGLVATYAATLPVCQRRHLYSAFLRSLEGDKIRQEALERAQEHLSGDVPAILKQVVEDIRLETPSVALRGPGQVPEGDLQKIEALSWLLDHPQLHREALVQANTLARHLVLQEYQESSAVSGTGARLSASPFFHGSASWAETPVVLSSRIDAVGLLLEVFSAGRDDSGLAKAVDEAGADAAREQESWALLLEVRGAYMYWASMIREQERQVPPNAGMLELPDSGRGGDVVVRESAQNAMMALERILTFKDGWMFPRNSSDSPDLSNPDTPSAASIELVNGQNGSGIASSDAIATIDQPNGVSGAWDADQGMDISSPLGIGFGEAGNGEDPDVQEMRLARAVTETRNRRTKELEEEMARLEQTSKRVAEATRKEEMLRVRHACLPGLVFMAHEIAHGTGAWMFSRGRVDVAREWFLRCQSLANMVVKEEYLTLRALSPEDMGRLLKLMERSCTKLLECDEPRA